MSTHPADDSTAPQTSLYRSKTRHISVTCGFVEWNRTRRDQHGPATGYVGTLRALPLTRCRSTDDVGASALERRGTTVSCEVWPGWAR